MPKNVFVPNFARVALQEEAEAEHDVVTTGLLLVARWLVIGLVFLLPLFFLPGIPELLGTQKTLLASGLVGTIISILGLLLLRQREVRTVVPLSLLAFAGFVVVSVVSALFAPSPLTAFRGDAIATDTVFFWILLLGTMIVPLVLQGSTAFVRRFYLAASASSLLLLTYAAVRFVLGPLLPLGSFFQTSTTPFGALNDVAIFATATLLAFILSLFFLGSAGWQRIVLQAGSVLALFVLMVINYTFLWYVVALLGAALLGHRLLYQRFFTREAPTVGHVPLWLSTLLGGVSLAYVFAGGMLSGYMAQWSDISYVEVRPSLSATVDVIDRVYEQQLWLGAGPAHFDESWRLYKDDAITQSIFWATDFRTGSSYVTTIATTTGVLGVAFFLLFQVLFVWRQQKALFVDPSSNPFWRRVVWIATSVALFLWGMTYVHVPGHALLLLTGLATGLSFVAGVALVPRRTAIFAVVTSKVRGFVWLVAVIILLVTVVGGVIAVYVQYETRAAVVAAQATATSTAAFDQVIASAYRRYPDPLFLHARTQIALAELDTILAIDEPTAADQEQFIATSERALMLANIAVATAPTEPQSHFLLARLFTTLSLTGIPEAWERARSAMAEAQVLDPHNPQYDLVIAEAAIQRGELVAAREALLLALEKKANYSEALYALAQLAIAEGDIEAAIERVLSVLALEPQNATRYYQLGLLLTEVARFEEAFAAYSVALELNPQYANARYFRALLLAEVGQISDAAAELRTIVQSNPDNTALLTLIAELEAAIEAAATASTVAVPVAESTPTQDESGVVTTAVAPDTDLVAPVNQTPPEAQLPVSDLQFVDPTINAASSSAAAQ